MPFGVGGFNPPSKQNFNGTFSKGIGKAADFTSVPDWELDVNAFKFTPKSNNVKSQIRFYDHDSLWSRWRRGYELYTITQSVLGSYSTERRSRGDYRMYCTFQQFPGVFVPARVFTFPSPNKESGEQLVGMRDTNGFNFYNFGLSILEVRYLGPVVSTTYSQTGTTITVSKPHHGLLIGENVYLDFLSGGGIDETLPVISTTQNTFTLTASAPVTTSGNLNYYLSTTFSDVRWTTTRVRLRSLPTPVQSFAGERLADRVIERDPGIASTYSRTGSTVSVTCADPHGLSSTNKVFVSVTSGAVPSGQYIITVTGPTTFTFTTIDSGTTSGNLILKRLISGFRYDDYVGYTVLGFDSTTNEIIFQREDSYGTRTVNNTPRTVIPAHRGFEVGRFLTTELRWQCSCQDYMRRSGYDLYSELTKRRFPVTPITSTKPGQVLDQSGILSNERDVPGSFGDLGYVTINNFYELPTYKDTDSFSYANLMYYQLRWCKHIYAAMFSLIHDEGTEPIAIAAKYVQAGPTITVEALDHNLSINTKIQLDFSSGNALSGQYTITSVPNKDTFTVVYPFSEVTSGYCTVSNLKEHEYVGSWLLEPSDRPIGDELDTFYRNFEKENEKVRRSADRMLLMMEQGVKWVGSKAITGSRNQPEQVANYDPELVTMMLTDNIRRDQEGALDREGISVNTTNRLMSMLSKLFNLTPLLIQDVKIGVLDQPLVGYVSEFEFGLIQGGTYLNGVPVEPASQTSTIDCETYTPLTAQDIQVDGSLYINT
jgi:hypothetical protein